MLLSSEIRDTVMIAVASILLASLLGFVAFLMGLRGDFASIRNNEVYTAKAMAEYKEFNKYNGTILLREDVIAAIRDYYNTDVRIAVKNRAGSIIYYMDKYEARNPYSTTPLKVSDLMNFFSDTTKRYKSVVVYGQVDLDDVTESYVEPSVNSKVTAIVFFEQ